MSSTDTTPLLDRAHDAALTVDVARFASGTQVRIPIDTPLDMDDDVLLQGLVQLVLGIVGRESVTEAIAVASVDDVLADVRSLILG